MDGVADYIRRARQDFRRRFRSDTVLYDTTNAYLHVAISFQIAGQMPWQEPYTKNNNIKTAGTYLACAVAARVECSGTFPS
jgi:hypothetical protein